MGLAVDQRYPGNTLVCSDFSRLPALIFTDPESYPVIHKIWRGIPKSNRPNPLDRRTSTPAESCPLTSLIYFEASAQSTHAAADITRGLPVHRASKS